MKAKQVDTGALADRIRAALGRKKTVEKQMFGGITFMHNGNMVCVASKRGLIVRVGPEAMASALEEPHTAPFIMGERATKGYIVVDPAAIDEGKLKEWVDRARKFVDTLPAK